MQQQPPTEAMPEDWQTALAIVAHPDDLEYGAASAVAKWTAQGKKIVYVMVSRGEAGINDLRPSEVGPLRSEEEVNAARVVGVDTVEFLDHPDGVIEYGLPLRRDISRVIRRYRPEVILTLSHHLQFPTGHLNMADHRNVGIAVFGGRRPRRRQPLDIPGTAGRGPRAVERRQVRSHLRPVQRHPRHRRDGLLGTGVGLPAPAQALSGISWPRRRRQNFRLPYRPRSGVRPFLRL